MRTSSLATLRNWLPLSRLIVMKFEQQTSVFGLERPVVDAGRPAGICGGMKLNPAIALRVAAHDQVAFGQINFFPMVMHEGFLGEHAGPDTQQARPAAALVHFIQIACENLLAESLFITGRCLPALAHIN